jgi:mRNA-degrading endonuclease YafQ of YafQ-DinJ toxin-antitoxin module
LTGKNEPVWSISITMSIRMLYKIIGEDYYLMDIGTHEEVYKRKN